jgi:hypothetical protein
MFQAHFDVCFHQLSAEVPEVQDDHSNSCKLDRKYPVFSDVDTTISSSSIKLGCLTQVVAIVVIHSKIKYHGWRPCTIRKNQDLKLVYLL